MCVMIYFINILWTLGWFQKQLIRTRSMLEHVNRGQMKEFCSLISNLFLFFSWHFRVVPHFRSKFSKTKGGTLWWKKSEKNGFWRLIPQKNRLEKCRMAVKSVFGYIDFWGSYGLNSAKKWPKSPKLLKMPIFRHFFNVLLVKKNLYVLVCKIFHFHPMHTWHTSF